MLLRPVRLKLSANAVSSVVGCTADMLSAVSVIQLKATVTHFWPHGLILCSLLRMWINQMGNCCSTSPAPQEPASSDNFFHCLRALSAHWVVSFWELLQQDSMIAGSIKRCGEKIISQQTYKWILKGLGKDIPSNVCNATSEREGMRSAVQRVARLVCSWMASLLPHFCWRPNMMLGLIWPISVVILLQGVRAHGRTKVIMPIVTTELSSVVWME